MKRETLEEFQRLDAERRDLDRRSRALKERCDQILDEVKTDLEKDGKTSAKRFGFLLNLVAKSATVSWKDAFIREVSAERAAELQAEAARQAKTKAEIICPA